MCQISVCNMHWALIFLCGVKGVRLTLMYMCMPHVNTLKNNVKFFKVFKSKIMKTQIVPQWAIRMQKKLYILKPYTKLSLPKNF